MVKRRKGQGAWWKIMSDGYEHLSDAYDHLMTPDDPAPLIEAVARCRREHPDRPPEAICDIEELPIGGQIHNDA